LEKRGAAFGKYFFGVFFGPLLGPIIGGVLIISKDGWRATFWFCLALGLFAALIVFLLLPETYRDNAKFDLALPHSTSDPLQGLETVPDTSINEKSQLPNESPSSTVEIEEDRVTIVSTPQPPVAKARMNPLTPFFLLRHPFVLLTALVGGIAFGSMFAVETIIPSLYETKYNFNSWQTGKNLASVPFTFYVLTLFWNRVIVSWCWYR
jgi:MFS family permease